MNLGPLECDGVNSAPLDDGFDEQLESAGSVAFRRELRNAKEKGPRGPFDS